MDRLSIKIMVCSPQLVRCLWEEGGTLLHFAMEVVDQYEAGGNINFSNFEYVRCQLWLKDISPPRS